jgi:hypothetical protein
MLVLAAALAGHAGEPPDKRDADSAPEAAQAPRGAASGKATPLSLTAAQQQAVGIRVDRPLPLNGAPQIQAYGTVLDPASLGTDAERVAYPHAADVAALVLSARLYLLDPQSTQASLKAWQASQAQSVEAAARRARPTSASASSGDRSLPGAPRSARRCCRPSAKANRCCCARTCPGTAWRARSIRMRWWKWTA